MTKNCGRALEVVGTLPENAATSQCRQYIQRGGGRAATNRRAPCQPGRHRSGPASSRRSAGPPRPTQTAGPPRSRDEIRKDALRKITAGQTMSGVIKKVTNFGAFVNLGDDVTGQLIHISQLSTKRLGTPPRSSTSTTASR